MLGKLGQKGAAPVLILLAVIGVAIFLVVASTFSFKNTALNNSFEKPTSQAAPPWAFEETFDYGVPTAPSQSLLPRNFDYAVTHRNHPAEPESTMGSSYPADHDEDCSFIGDNSKQHTVTNSTHRSTGANPDQSFFICNNHMMTSMGDIEGYSVTTFWPRQEFDFTGGGTVEFDVNLNWQSRNWFEMVIMPRNQFQIAPAIASLPIDEEYSKDRLVFRFGSPTAGARDMSVGVTEPTNGEDNERNRSNDWGRWYEMFPNDPANTDRRIRRKNIVKIEENKITWSIQKQDGTFDDLVLDVPQGLPFHRGLVQFKTHAYTPDKDGLHHRHTFHWDNIRFTGPVLTPFETFESPDIIALLEAPGATQTQTITLPRIGNNLILSGQVMWRSGDQALLSINGGPNMPVKPHSGAGNDEGPCFDEGWSTFIIPLQTSQLRVGANTFKWTVGPRPACTNSWDGFNVKGVEVQMDVAGGAASPVPTPTAAPTSTPTSTQTLSAQLNSNQEVQTPKPNSAATGTGSVVLNETAGTATVTLNFSGLTSTQTAAHIHGPAPAGQNAGVLFTLPNGSFTNHQITGLTATQIQQLKASQWYFNVHTTNFSNGEIRGQILPPGATPIPTPSPTQAATPTPTPVVTPTPSTLPGDANNSGRVDIFDYNIIVSQFNQTGTNLQGDLNKSGRVDIFDYNLVVANFGRSS